jgi:hypothetical protein
MATYVHRIADGSLYSYNPSDSDPVADDATLAANGLAKVSGLAPIDDTHAWDAATLSIVAVPAPVKPNPIGAGNWMTRFTLAERTAIRGSTDPVVVDLLWLIAHQATIDLTDKHIVDGVNYLVSAGLLDASRVAAILE